MRRLLTVLLLALLGFAAPAASQQGGNPPTELWKEYPLETVPSAPPSEREQQGGGTEPSPPARSEPREPAPQSPTSTSEADDGGVATFALIAIILLVVLASAAIVRLGLKARRSRVPRRPRPAAAAARGPALATATAGPTSPSRAERAAEDEAAPSRAEPEPDAAKPEAAEPEGEPEPVTAKPEPAAEPQPEPATKPQPVTAAEPAEPERESKQPEPEPVASPPEPPEPPVPAEPEPPAAEPPAAVPAPPAHAPRRPRPVPEPGNGHHPSRPTPAIPAPAQAEAQRSDAGRRIRQVAPEDERALGYTTVARPQDAESQLRTEAREIQLACKKRGLPLKKLVRDLESRGGADLTRPGLSFALERLGNGEYTCLVVTSLDRLTRSAANLATLIYLLEERRTRLIVVDIDLDTGTEEGRLAARALVNVSGLERKKLEEQTRKGPEAARDKRRSSGRPAVADRPTLRRRIAEMRTAGMTLQAIADTLNEEGVPTLRGGAQWRPSSVQAAAGYKRPPRKSGAKARKGANGN